MFSFTRSLLTVGVDNGPLRELGLYLILTLGKLDIPAKEIY